MTISAGTDKDVYDGDGATDEWPITFSVTGLSSDDIKVYKTTTAGVSTLLTSNYTVDLTTPEIVYPTTGTKLATGEQIVIIPSLTIEQTTNYKNQGGVPPETLENDLDRHVRMLKQIDERLNRIPESDISDDEFSANALISAASASAVSSASASASSLASSILSAASAVSASSSADLAAASAAAASGVVSLSAASQAEAEAGTENTKYMTSLRSKQSFDKHAILNTLDPKVTIAAADIFLAEDSADSNARKKVLFSSLQSLLGLNVHVGTFSRDISTATGSQTITGVGFTPKTLIIFGCVSGTMYLSFGTTDASTDTCVYIHGVETQWYSYSAGMILFYASAGNEYVGVLSSFNSDGFVIGWTKIGTIAGASQMKFLAIG